MRGLRFFLPSTATSPRPPRQRSRPRRIRPADRSDIPHACQWCASRLLPPKRTKRTETHQPHHFRQGCPKSEVDAMNNPELPRPINDTENPPKVLFAAAIGAFVGRIAGDGASDARRAWLPKLWDWLEQ